MLLKPRLLHKPKNNFGQDFLPAILLGEGMRAGGLEVKTLLEVEWAHSPALPSCRTQVLSPREQLG